MKCLVGIDDTDSSFGLCTTYLAFRVASDLGPLVRVLPYPRLVRLNPNIPFKTRGNAAVALLFETEDPRASFKAICSAVARHSDVAHGANPGVVMLDDPLTSRLFVGLYDRALRGVVNVSLARRFIERAGARAFALGNGMGLVGAAAALAFDERFDHTCELISYRRASRWGTPRLLDAGSVREMDAATFPHTFNNYDYQKKKVLIAPSGPDPVFAGVRGDSPPSVIAAFRLLRAAEPLLGYMVYITNQQTDAHLAEELDWKAYSAGWAEGRVERVEVGPGGHVYLTLRCGREARLCAIYEPTGDLRREAKGLMEGDSIRAYGGVRRPSSKHPKILNVEKLEVVSAAGRDRRIVPGVYVSSPRANRHLTKPLVRYGNELSGTCEPPAEGWLQAAVTPRRAPGGSPR